MRDREEIKILYLCTMFEKLPLYKANTQKTCKVKCWTIRKKKIYKEKKLFEHINRIVENNKYALKEAGKNTKIMLKNIHINK